jgi:hypothetical protein
MATEEEVPWEGRVLTAAYNFAALCIKLRDSNPYGRPTLEEIMPDLVTSLWDNGFSQSEIRIGFERALSQLPRYAAGEERRGDKKQK